jgi:peroxiredoxin
MERRPEQGDRAPDFELPDSTGTKRTLGELLREGNVLLVFFRGVW